MHARLVLPHQLFDEQRTADADLLVLVEPDLFFRQYAFHTHKLVLHRASMRRFAAEVRQAGRATAYVESRGDRDTDAQLVELLREREVTEVSWCDVVDDWLDRDLRRVADQVGAEVTVEETPAFLTSDADVNEQLGRRRGSRPRMSTFYAWQRRRLDVLMDGDGPVGGKWSFDEDNREPYPKGGLDVPPLPRLQRDEHVRDAIAWVAAEFPDNPGDPDGFRWPTTRAQAKRWLASFVEDRLRRFGPHEDAIAADEPFLLHSTLSPVINIGLLSPREVLDAVLAADDVPLASLEGFVRQVIGWREYMRGIYVTQGRRLRTTNRLHLTRALGPGWWDGTTGLHPVDVVVRRVLRHGYAHHIERLMVIGNAMLLLRTDPDDVYEWFMALFVDAYDWVMVPNVYAMSQFAAAEAITTKPYVSGSNYVLKMSDFSKRDGEAGWADAWDALYWQFVDDHRDGFAANPRTSMAVRTLEKMKDARRRELAEVAERWLGGDVPGVAPE